MHVANRDADEIRKPSYRNLLTSRYALSLLRGSMRGTDCIRALGRINVKCGKVWNVLLVPFNVTVEWDILHELQSQPLAFSETSISPARNNNFYRLWPCASSTKAKALVEVLSLRTKYSE